MIRERTGELILLFLRLKRINIIYINPYLFTSLKIYGDVYMVEDQQRTQSPFLSPTELIKTKSVSLLLECIEHNARSQDEKEKYAFFKKTKDLSVLLERYTPKKAIQELREWYKQLDDEVKTLKNKNYTEEKERRLILEKMYTYALQTHEHNQRILMNSPIIEIDAEGELDINDPEVINVVRGGKRKDDKRIVYKQ